MAGTITGASAVIMLSVPGLFSTPQQLQGFATDDIFDTAAIASAETLMGVDGNLSGGNDGGAARDCKSRPSGSGAAPHQLTMLSSFNSRTVA